jgi:hypothetical protein
MNSLSVAINAHYNTISLSIIAGVDLLTSEQIRLLKLVSKMFFSLRMPHIVC